MEKDKMSEKFRNMYEPLFGGDFRANNIVFMTMKWVDTRQILRCRINRRVGAEKNGGYIIDYACGCISLKQYLMKCQLKNVTDFNIDIIEDTVKFWESWISNHNGVYWENIVDYMRSRIKTLRYELRQLNSKMNDML